ncbi:MAG: nickel ABC transporter permease [Candidatus Methylomirabilales bacterium]|nr:ABC transporter permease [candidate division NC10 bacterium]MCZ6549798.1 ABC transporter permease [candidate division NC10 bacterium]
MGRYILKRLLLLLPVAWGVSTLVFLLIHLTPGDPVEVMLGETALPAAREALRRTLHLDRSLPEQYFLFLQGLFTGDLGISLFSRESVSTTILKALPATIELALAGLVVALMIALPLGVLAAVKKDSGLDHGSRFVALLGISIPNFVLGPLLILAFAIQLDWLPVSGRGGFAHLVLPALTLGMALAGILSRMVRASLLEVLGQEYIRAARAKGLSEGRVILRHGLKASLIPVITVVGLQIGALLSGAIITEIIFAWPGLGRLTLQAIQARDYPLVQGCVLMFSFGYVLVNTATDLLYAYVDPRIRYD